MQSRPALRKRVGQSARSRPRLAFVASACAAALVGLCAGAARADDVRLLGRVNKLDAEGFELRTARVTLSVKRDASAPLLELAGQTLQEAADGARLLVLARYQPEVRDPETNMPVPAQLVQIQAIVVLAEGVALEAPPVSKALSDRKLEWKAGTLRKTPSGFQLDHGDQTNMQWGPTRPVLLARAAEAAALARGATALVWAPTPDDPRKREVAASAVAVVDRRAPADQVRVLAE